MYQHVYMYLCVRMVEQDVLRSLMGSFQERHRFSAKKGVERSKFVCRMDPIGIPKPPIPKPTMSPLRQT